MNETEQALARELARHPGWRWLAGMKVIDGPSEGRMVVDDADWYQHEDGGQLEPDPWAVPDLADPATQGCLIAMIREYVPQFMISLHNLGVTVEQSFGDTLGEAIARAWLAVNGEEPKP